MTIQFSELQLDALREMANIGSGTAATSLSQLVGRPVDVSVPHVYVTSFADAVDTVGESDAEIYAVLVQILGDLDTMVVLLFHEHDARVICGLLGVGDLPDYWPSALQEVGNILAASYTGAIATMTGLDIEPAPPTIVVDMLGAVVGTVVTYGADETDSVLMLDSNLLVEGENTKFAFAFLLTPRATGVGTLLERLGLPF